MPVAFLLHQTEFGNTAKWLEVIQDHCCIRGTALACVKIRQCLVLAKRPAQDSVSDLWLGHCKNTVQWTWMFVYLSCLKLLLNSQIKMFSKYTALLPSETGEWDCPGMCGASVTNLRGTAPLKAQNTKHTCVFACTSQKHFSFSIGWARGKWSNFLRDWLEGEKVVLSLKSDWREE